MQQTLLSILVLFGYFGTTKFLKYHQHDLGFG